MADWLTQVAAAPVFAVLFLSLVPGGGALSRFLATRPAIRLGDLSDGTYLLPVALASAAVWLPLVSTIGAGPAAFGYVGALLALAHVARQVVELPIRRGIVGFYDRRARTREAALAARSDLTS